MNQNERNINCYKATSNIICLRRQSPSAMQCNDLVLRPGTGAEYCDQLVCLSVCPRAYLWNRWTDLREIFVQIPCGRGSVLLWRRCDTLCTSGFMDDVTFGRSGPYGDTLNAEPTITSGIAIPESDVHECLVLSLKEL